LEAVNSDRRLWSATFVNGLGILFSPFASIALQAVNYRRAGLGRDVRVCWCWFAALFVAQVIWSQIPLPVAGTDRIIFDFLYTFATWVVWFVAFGRTHRRKLGQLPGATVDYRSALSALAWAIVVWLVSALILGVFIVLLVRIRF
jgi:hypothetical protein